MMLQPGDRIAWVGTDGKMRVDIVDEHGDVVRGSDPLSRLAAMLETVQGTIRELLGLSGPAGGGNVVHNGGAKVTMDETGRYWFEDEPIVREGGIGNHERP